MLRRILTTGAIAAAAMALAPAVAAGGTAWSVSIGVPGFAISAGQPGYWGGSNAGYVGVGIGYGAAGYGYGGAGYSYGGYGYGYRAGYRPYYRPYYPAPRVAVYPAPVAYAAPYPYAAPYRLCGARSLRRRNRPGALWCAGLCAAPDGRRGTCAAAAGRGSLRTVLTAVGPLLAAVPDAIDRPGLVIRHEKRAVRRHGVRRRPKTFAADAPIAEFGS